MGKGCMIFKKILNKDVNAIYEPVGCDDCFSGYRGRAAVHEVLLLNQDIRDAITNNLRKEDLRLLVYDKKNTFTLLEDGLEKVILGTTSMDEIIRVISIEDDFGEDDEEIKKAFIGSDIGESPSTKSDETQTTEEKHNDIVEML